MSTSISSRSPKSISSNLDEVERVYRTQRANCAAVGLTTARQRIEKLRRLRDALLARRDEVRAALWADYQKPVAEVDLSEIYPVAAEAKHAIRHLRRWMKPQRVRAPLALMGSRSRIVYEPKGLVLIISPWNFPINLTLGPLVSAIAAGNCAILKPSEMTPNASGWMKRFIGDLFEENEVAVIEGDAPLAENLLRKKFDHIFFTGSPAVGKIVMHAAAEHLTSVTLELGGKSPVIVDRTADLDEAAKKIAWGKSFNSGQICIAPDYVLVDETIRAPFIEKLRAAATMESGLLVNDRHAARVRNLLGVSGEGRKIPLTIAENVAVDGPLMREEIFGPVLPIVPYRDVDDAIRIVNEREKPLVLYLFSRKRRVIDRVLRRTRAGGTVVNDTLIHFYQLNLPFGGVGQSGMGKAHGFFGFQAFSNARAVLEQPWRFSAMQLLYPPYTKFKQKLIDFTVRYL